MFYLKRTYQPSLLGSDYILQLLHCYLKQGHWQFFHQCQKYTILYYTNLFTGEKQITYLTAHVMEGPTICEQWPFVWDFNAIELGAVKYLYMNELVLVHKLSLTKNSSDTKQQLYHQNIYPSLLGSRIMLAEHSSSYPLCGMHIRHMVQNFSVFGWQKLCFYQSFTQ